MFCGTFAPEPFLFIEWADEKLHQYNKCLFEFQSIKEELVDVLTKNPNLIDTSLYSDLAIYVSLIESGLGVQLWSVYSTKRYLHEGKGQHPQYIDTTEKLFLSLQQRLHQQFCSDFRGFFEDQVQTRQTQDSIRYITQALTSMPSDKIHPLEIISFFTSSPEKQSEIVDKVVSFWNEQGVDSKDIGIKIEERLKESSFFTSHAPILNREEILNFISPCEDRNVILVVTALAKQNRNLKNFFEARIKISLPSIIGAVFQGFINSRTR